MRSQKEEEEEEEEGKCKEKQIWLERLPFMNQPEQRLHQQGGGVGGEIHTSPAQWWWFSSERPSYRLATTRRKSGNFSCESAVLFIAPAAKSDPRRAAHTVRPRSVQLVQHQEAPSLAQILIRGKLED